MIFDSILACLSDEGAQSIEVKCITEFTAMTIRTMFVRQTIELDWLFSNIVEVQFVLPDFVKLRSC